jgi:hypothetical protein
MSRKPSHICVLTDGRRIRYSLQERGGYYNVCFRGPDGRRKFLSTKERTVKRAEDAACVVIRQEYEPKSSSQKVAWDEALAVAEKAMKEQNLRERSIRAYLDQIKRVRTVFPSLKGPAEITPAKAKQFKAALVEKKLAPYTISTCLRDLTSIWNKWFIGECKLLEGNPWEEIERPELDEPEPRYIEPQEEQAFHDWLLKRWDGWRLPVLFFRVKSLVGRRILQLASLPSDRLDEEGRLFFSSRNGTSTTPGYPLTWRKSYKPSPARRTSGSGTSRTCGPSTPAARRRTTPPASKPSTPSGSSGGSSSRSRTTARRTRTCRASARSPPTTSVTRP